MPFFHASMIEWCCRALRGSRSGISRTARLCAAAQHAVTTVWPAKSSRELTFYWLKLAEWSTRRADYRWGRLRPQMGQQKPCWWAPAGSLSSP